MDLEDEGLLYGRLVDVGVDESIGLTSLDANFGCSLRCMDSMSNLGGPNIFFDF